MMPWWSVAFVVFGMNFVLWAAIGLARLLEESWRKRRRRRSGPPASALTAQDVAVLIPAHNEELVIESSIEAIAALVPRENIHVVSDGSTDRTAELARQAGVNVIETRTNVGKAGALEEAIDRFKLVERFPVVLLLDADTTIEPGYLAAALPQFDDPKVVAVAGAVRTQHERDLSLIGRVLVCHRQRIYAISQRLLKFGQTWRFTNATHIVPGFASMYRTAVLPRIEMNPPDLVIEDFNMTFEIYQKRLGKVAFTLDAVAVTQDPDNLHDYIRQIKRWGLGLWQTVRRHPPQLSLFSAMLTVLLLELLTSSMFFVLLPLLVLILAVPAMHPAALAWPELMPVHDAVAAHLSLQVLLFAGAGADLVLSCVVALIERRLRFLVLGVFFPFLRVLDAAVALYVFPRAWLSSTGRWTSPVRRTVEMRPALGAQRTAPVLPPRATARHS
ncbi:MAG: glycosyltransferase family 2 protein [Pseudonocardiales bacterium]|nr:glycosyltransferase family 2 protein [Pseudonocardiales bacterium]